MGAIPAAEPTGAMSGPQLVQPSPFPPPEKVAEPPASTDIGLENTAAGAVMPSTLSLRVLKGPLLAAERSAVLAEYTRVTGVRVTVQNFARWAEESPDGPALHAFLETRRGRLAGHCCLVPLRMPMSTGDVKVGVPRYFFVSADHELGRVEGREVSHQSIETTLLAQLYGHAAREGWSPIFVHPAPEERLFHRAAGCRTIALPVRECIFVLNPAQAWRYSRSLALNQKMGFVVATAMQQGFARCMLPFAARNGRVRNARIGEPARSLSSRSESGFVSSEEERFLKWRYPHGMYSRLVVGDASECYVIARKGSAHQALRICQWHGASDRYLPSLVKGLIREAARTGSAGVHWSVYGNGAEQERIVGHLGRQHFYPISRNVRALVYSSKEEFFSPENWNLSDSLVSLPD
ncbi:MAG TPA: hypothetical protein VEJ67_15345 [Candidatus Cybelea sp.]|nr:hypothetical protein [Candidatus Cybelea sp.]